MENSDRDRFSVLMAMLAEVFGAASALKIQTYWLALKEFPLPDLEAAAGSCLLKFRTLVTEEGRRRAPWPTPGDIIAELWGGGEADGVPPDPVKRKALPEPRCDPEVAKKHLAAMYALLDKTAGKMPKVRAVAVERSDPRYREIVQQERWFMQESHWRARWELGKKDPEYRPIAQAIPEHFRVQFAVEDQLAAEANADRAKVAEPHHETRVKAVPF